MDIFFYLLVLSVLVVNSQVIQFTKDIAQDEAPKFTEMYFDQFVDHFNFKSHGSATYKQRFLITEQYMKEGGPIFFYAGNEGPIEGFQKASGFLTEHAPKFGALVVFAEHRYYGKSLPLGEKSFMVDNLGLLTIEQALADYAYLLKYLRSKYCSKPCPVIAFGGSYGGQLAAYLRFKYPDLIAGSLSASAPIYWISGLGDPHGFFKSVTDQFAKSSQMCVNLIKQAFSETQKMADQGKYADISSSFHTCKQVNSSTLDHLYKWVRNAFTSIAMVNYPYPSDLLGPMPGHPVDVACSKMTSASNVVTGLANAAGVFYNATAVTCYNIFEDFVDCADPTGCGLGDTSTAWDYQACTEINLPQGSTGKTDMFPLLPLTPEMRAEYCQKKYGVTPRVDWLDVQFWGANISSASNIIFSNGDLDPWGPGGVHTSPAPSLVALEVIGGAHHLDLRSSNPKDPQSVIDVRNQEANIIMQWITDFYER
uniref:dipeptidyl peptidase 2-like n=1 Tax=Styela clava TaxID=7725 RepID=UPI0019395025|nr:dipeptidyl peptidase 2-like [Styela clava]